jgi:hypothetical protein
MICILNAKIKTDESPEGVGCSKSCLNGNVTMSLGTSREIQCIHIKSSHLPSPTNVHLRYSMMDKSNEYCTSDLEKVHVEKCNFYCKLPLLVVTHGWVSMYVLSANHFHSLLSPSGVFPIINPLLSLFNGANPDFSSCPVFCSPLPTRP